MNNSGSTTPGRDTRTNLARESIVAEIDRLQDRGWTSQDFVMALRIVFERLNLKAEAVAVARSGIRAKTALITRRPLAP